MKYNHLLVFARFVQAWVCWWGLDINWLWRHAGFSPVCSCLRVTSARQGLFCGWDSCPISMWTPPPSNWIQQQLFPFIAGCFPWCEQTTVYLTVSPSQDILLASRRLGLLDKTEGTVVCKSGCGLVIWSGECVTDQEWNWGVTWDIGFSPLEAIGYFLGWSYHFRFLPAPSPACLSGTASLRAVCCVLIHTPGSSTTPPP